MKKRILAITLILALCVATPFSVMASSVMPVTVLPTPNAVHATDGGDVTVAVSGGGLRPNSTYHVTIFRDDRGEPITFSVRTNAQGAIHNTPGRPISDLVVGNLTPADYEFTLVPVGLPAGDTYPRSSFNIGEAIDPGPGPGPGWGGVGGGGGGLPSVDRPENVSISGTVVSWNAVANATGYRVYVNGVARSDVITATSFNLATLNLPPGEHRIQIRAIGDERLGNSGLTAAIIFTVPGIPGDRIFTDVPPGAWFADYVAIVYNAGLFQGTAPGVFSPQLNMTRGMLAQVLANLEGVNLSPFAASEPTFGDTASGAWYFPAVQWAAGEGLVMGIGDGNFAPNANVTREQIAVMIYRYAQLRDISLPQNGGTSFSDQASVSGWATEGVAAMAAAGIVRGRDDGRFDPQATATRAEVAAMFARFLELMED